LIRVMRALPSPMEVCCGRKTDDREQGQNGCHEPV
jgi:hypothetical protein